MESGSVVTLLEPHTGRPYALQVRGTQLWLKHSWPTMRYDVCTKGPNDVASDRLRSHACDILDDDTSPLLPTLRRRCGD